MLGHYLKAGLQNLLRHKGYSLINIVGLAIGLAVCLLIFRYVHMEITYDGFHENGDDIYKFVALYPEETGEGDFTAPSPIPLEYYFLIMWKGNRLVLQHREYCS